MPRFRKKPVVIETIIYDGDKPDDDPVVITTFNGKFYVFHRNSVWVQKLPWYVRLWRWLMSHIKQNRPKL